MPLWLFVVSLQNQQQVTSTWRLLTLLLVFISFYGYRSILVWWRNHGWVAGHRQLQIVWQLCHLELSWWPSSRRGVKKYLLLQAWYLLESTISLSLRGHLKEYLCRVLWLLSSGTIGISRICYQSCRTAFSVFISIVQAYAYSQSCLLCRKSSERGKWSWP